MHIMDVALFEALGWAAQSEGRARHSDGTDRPAERAEAATGSPQGYAPGRRWRSILKLFTGRHFRSRHELPAIHIDRLAGDVAGQRR